MRYNIATGALSWYAPEHWGWYVLALCLFLHGMVYAFLVNGFHELCHSTDVTGEARRGQPENAYMRIAIIGTAKRSDLLRKIGVETIDGAS